ncbi:MAG: glycosyltransferase [Actinomycetes bacterium]
MASDGPASDAPTEPDDRDRLRVLWLTKGLDLGGQERLLALLAKKHDRATVAIECAFTADRLRFLVGSLEAAGVTCRSLSPSGRKWSWIVQLWGLLGENRFDVVHAHSPLVASVARVMVALKRRQSKPVMMTTSHLVWSGYHPLTRGANRITAWLDDVSIAVSPAVLRSMRGRARRRGQVMVQGVDIAELRTRFVAPVDDRANQTDRRREVVVCTVANLSPQKDYPMLLSAAKIVAATQPDVRFVAVGYDVDAYAADMRDLRDRLGLARQFDFVGLNDDAVAVMAASDVYVVSSRFEAGPVAAMEAAVIGVPIVTTDVGIMSDAFSDGVDCLRVPVGDAPALAGALLRLIGDRELQNRLRENGRQLANDRFDIARVIVDLQNLYRNQVALRAVG